MKTYNFAFIGKKGVGKTSFVKMYKNIVPSFYLDEEQQYLHLVSVKHTDGVSDVILWDFADHLIVKPYLHLSLKFASVIFICYSVSDCDSLCEIHKYFQYIDRKNQVVILLGLKIDLRNNFILNDCLSYQDGYITSRRHNFDGFLECSTADDINCMRALALGIELDSKNQIIKINIPYYKKIAKIIIMSFKTFFSACFSYYRDKNNRL